MHNHSLSVDNRSDFVAINTAVIVEEMKSHAILNMFLTKDKVPCAQKDVYSTGVYTWESLQECVLRWKRSQLPSLAPTQEQDDEFEVVESNEDDWAATDLTCFSKTANKRRDIWIRIDQIQDVQHCLRDADLGHAYELKASFCHHSVDYSSGIIYVTVTHPFVEKLEACNILINEERQMGLPNDCNVRVVDRSHRLILLRTLH